MASSTRSFGPHHPGSRRGGNALRWRPQEWMYLFHQRSKGETDPADAAGSGKTFACNQGAQRNQTAMNFTPNLALAEVSAVNHTPRRDTKTPSLYAPAFSCRGPGARRRAPIPRRLLAAPRPAAPFGLVRAFNGAFALKSRSDLKPSGEFPHV